MPDTVLIVDDEPGIRSLLVRGLTSAGYRTVEASDGLEAWLLLRDQAVHVDLVLTDVVMPYVTGMELAEKIRHDFPHLPVILLSAYSPSDLAARGLAPSEELVTKPFDLQDLVRRIEDVLGRDRPNPPAA